MNDENVEVICQSSNAREQSVSSENLSTHQIFFQPRWKISNEIFLVEAYRNLNPVMELYKDWQRRNSASLEKISSCSFVTLYYINIVIKYFILSITLSSHVPSFYYRMSQSGTNVQSFDVLLKLKQLGWLQGLQDKKDQCLMSIIHSDRNY